MGRVTMHAMTASSPLPPPLPQPLRPSARSRCRLHGWQGVGLPARTGRRTTDRNIYSNPRLGAMGQMRKAAAQNGKETTGDQAGSGSGTASVETNSSRDYSTRGNCSEAIMHGKCWTVSGYNPARVLRPPCSPSQFGPPTDQEPPLHPIVTKNLRVYPIVMEKTMTVPDCDENIRVYPIVMINLRVYPITMKSLQQS